MGTSVIFNKILQLFSLKKKLLFTFYLIKNKFIFLRMIKSISQFLINILDFLSGHIPNLVKPNSVSSMSAGEQLNKAEENQTARPPRLSFFHCQVYLCNMSVPIYTLFLLSITTDEVSVLLPKTHLVFWSSLHQPFPRISVISSHSNQCVLNFHSFMYAIASRTLENHFLLHFPF